MGHLSGSGTGDWPDERPDERPDRGFSEARTAVLS